MVYNVSVTHLFLLSLCLGGVSINAIFAYFDSHILGDRDDESGILYLFDLAVYTACGYYFVSFFHCFTLLLKFFLFLGLGTDHEEIEDYEDQDHHNPKRPLASLLCSTCLGLQ